MRDPTGGDLELTLSAGPERAVVAPLGASLRRYFTTEAGFERDIIWGYAGAAAKQGGQGDVLIPFPGRIRGGHYAFAGARYALERNDKDGPNAIHGFVRKRPWRVMEQRTDRAVFEITLAATDVPGYPFALAIRMEYSLDAAGLRARFAVRNDGDRPAPVGAGFHPYLLPAGNGPVDRARLEVPAAEVLEFADDLLPTGQIRPVEGTALDFRSARPIGDARLNHCFTAIRRDPDGYARARLHAEDRVTEVWWDRAFGYVVVYTGDAIAGHARCAVAIEPMTCATDAFNHEGWGTVALAPGETFAGEFGIGSRKP